jgi:hypothetical protein
MKFTIEGLEVTSLAENVFHATLADGSSVTVNNEFHAAMKELLRRQSCALFKLNDRVQLKNDFNIKGSIHLKAGSIGKVTSLDSVFLSVEFDLDFKGVLTLPKDFYVQAKKS